MLYLIQHGEAKSAAEDPERDLTEVGAAHAKAAGRFLAAHRIVADAVWHSPKVRAAHTARIIAGEIGREKQLAEHAGLLPGDDPAELAGEIRGLADHDLIVVGHLPFLPQFAALLIGGEASRSPVRFRNAGIVALSEQEGSWALDWAIIPELFEKER